MPLRFIDPTTRRSIAVAAILLGGTGLVMADHGGSSRPGLAIATGIDDVPATVTSVPFEARGARGRFAISHGRLLASGTRPMYVEIRVRSDDFAEVTPVAANVAMVLVIDTSGSMAGRKIEDARQSAIALLDEMRANDMVSVVRFASEASVLVPLGRVGDVREEARRQIRGLSAQGNTDIANALRSADHVLGWVQGGRVGRMVLVTDGRDTSGAPRSTGADVARAEASRGFTVSALGIGMDFDDDYLASVSQAGRGNYEFLRDTTALSRFLSKELKEASRTVVRNVEARLDLPEGARIRDVWGATWEGSRLLFGSLFAGDERRAVVALDVPTGEPGTSRSIGGALSWRVVDGTPVDVSLAPLRIVAVASPEEVDNARDMSVIASATSIIASRRETEAAAAFERGDRARALELNAESRAELDKVKMSAPAKIAKELEAQGRAYEAHQGAFAVPPTPAAAEAARGIGAAERKNADRAQSY